MSANNGVEVETKEVFLSPEALLEHWQGHRRLTRRTAQAFPEDQLFTFSADSMRPFGAMVLEVAIMLEPTLQHLLGEGADFSMEQWAKKTEAAQRETTTRAELLRRWDESSATLQEAWPRIPSERFRATESAFGLPPMPNPYFVLYAVDNEIHHRAQGYVYLRMLGVEPPAFWER